MYMLIIFIFIIFLIINRFYLDKIINNGNSKIELFENHQIIFYKKNNLYNILVKDNDNYFKSFFPNDLKVRNIQNINEYNNILKNSLCNPDEYIINKIKDYIIKINKKLKEYKKKYNEFEYVNIDKFIKVPWNIGFICNNNYENGLPHTRGNIIILNKNKIDINTDIKNIKTLIHEQIHIYQKMYPNELDYYINNKKFYKVKRKTKYDNIRANPDLDNYIYKDENNVVYKAVYNQNPTSIEDITYYPYNKQLYEHPNERMAIEFEKIINN